MVYNGIPSLKQATVLLFLIVIMPFVCLVFPDFGKNVKKVKGIREEKKMRENNTIKKEENDKKLTLK